VLQRWGGPVVHQHDTVPPAPSRNGPDHVLSHDARGAVRNTRNFGTIFARKLLDDAGVPVVGADGRPLPVEMLDTSLRAAAAADEMLDRVVWFIRLETDPLVVGPIPLTDLVDGARRAAHTTCAELADTAGMPELAAPLPVDLASTTGTDPAEVTVLGDREQLTWCVAELLVNARKFAGPTARVDLAVTPTDPWVHLRVTSAGTGIDPALVEDAFKLGRMLQPRGERPGVGMGLPLCRRILTRHGGRLTGSAAGPDATVFDLVLLSSLPTHRG
jgi:signal transduction histidine kinase